MTIPLHMDFIESRLNKWLEELTYKPKWIFQLHPAERDQWMLIIYPWTIDSDNGRENHLAHYKLYHQIEMEYIAVAQDLFNMWILNRIVEIETHEAMEFLKCNGERVIDPHPKGAEDSLSVKMPLYHVPRLNV